MQKLIISPWIVLIISLAITFSIGFSFLDSEYELQHIKFDTDIKSMTNAVCDRLIQYEQVLVGAKGLFAASSKVTLNEWKNYMEIQNIDTRFPGIQGVGYAHHIIDDEREDLVNELKNYGVADFAIKPEGIRDEYYPVIFIEPQGFENKRAMGYDLYVEETRRNAIDVLKETGKTTITGKITLVQETENNIQNGFLMFVPIYSTDQNILNASYDLEGIASAVFRMNDFTNGILDSELFQYVHLKIYDHSISEDNLLFDSDEISTTKIDKNNFSEIITKSVNNRNWIFVYEGIQPSLQGTDQFILFFIPIIGISMSFLLFYILRLFTKNLKLTQNALKSEKMVAIGQLASRMAHDIRNPLSIIRVSLENLKLKYGTDDVKEESFDRVGRSIDRIAHQIDDVLDFVKGSTAELSKVSFSKIISESLDSITIPNNIELILPKNDIEILADKKLFSIALNNLILNGIQAIDGTGTVEIDIEENDEVTIQVKDSGIGISKENLEKIFEPLFSTKQTGTGLGLSSVVAIIDAHHGKISVTSPPTIFTITLPKF